MSTPSRPAPTDAELIFDKRDVAPHALALRAAERPDEIGIVVVGGRAWTYRELDEGAHQWATALRRSGIAPGDHVATFMPNCVETYLLWFGIAWAGAVEVPFNTAYLGTMLSYAIDAADVSSIVIHRSFVPRLNEVLAGRPMLRRVVVVDTPTTGPGGAASAATRVDVVPVEGVTVIDETEFFAGVESDFSFAGPEYRDVASIIYTSGTTGPSKPVLVPWPAVFTMWSWAPGDVIAPGEALYMPFPHFHVGGKTVMINCIARGARVVLREKFSATEFWDDVRRFDCKVAGIVGPMTALLYAQPERADDADNPLRAVLVGPMIPEMDAFEKRFGVKVGVCYGMTEIGSVINSDLDHGPWYTCGRLRTDYPFPQGRLVNEFDEPVPVGEVGELVVRTDAPWALNLGYYKMPDKTAEAWRNGWFHTGDAFRLDEDGWFTFVDRMKDTIRRRGENISSFEVENIAREYDGVLDCAAFGVPAKLGEDEVMVAVVAHDRTNFDVDAFGAYCAAKLPRFMVPRYVEVVDELPRNETSLRVKKHELRARGVTSTTWDSESR
jgi:crotonobetaine/carnitine-CoA ligase